MRQGDGHPEDRQPPIRVAIVGNSNAIMKGSFARILARTPGFEIENWSIGATPSVVVLNFLAQSTSFDFDYIIIETAVVDFNLSATLYNHERSRETLELFIRSIRAVSTAKLLLLVIPTRHNLVEPDKYWQEELYLDLAARFQIPVVDGFSLMRRLIGPPKMKAVGDLMAQARTIVSAFGIPSYMALTLAWRKLRDTQNPTNALGFHGYQDDTHFSLVLYQLVARLLATYMRRDFVPRDAQAGPATVPGDIVIAATASGHKMVSRRSSLFSRELIQLRPGETALYRCPPNYSAWGLMMNQAATSCFLRVSSPAGEVVFDMRMAPRPVPWEGIIVPIVDPVGLGDVSVTICNDMETSGATRIVRGTEVRPSGNVAELAELLLVHDDWASIVPARAESEAPPPRINESPWAEEIIAEIAATTDMIVESVASESRIVDRPCFELIETIMTSKQEDLGATDRARTLLAIGRDGALTTFLDAALARDSEDAEVRQMRSAVDVLREIQPERLIDEAKAFIQDGKEAEAERVLERGMARFSSNPWFFTEWAWLPYRRKDWAEAIERWDFVRRSLPAHNVGYLALATCLNVSGRCEEADAVLRDAVRVFPADVTVAFSHAMCPLWLPDPAKSLARLIDLKARYPAHRPGRLGLVRAAVDTGAFDLAQQELAALIGDDRQAPLDDLIAPALDVYMRAKDGAWLQGIWPDLTTRLSNPVEAHKRLRTALGPVGAATLPPVVRTWLAGQTAGAA